MKMQWSVAGQERDRWGLEFLGLGLGGEEGEGGRRRWVRRQESMAPEGWTIGVKSSPHET